MMNLKNLKKNNEFNKNLIKFLSIIFNPKKYPISEPKVIKLVKILFKSIKTQNLIINDILFTEYGYYIENTKILNSTNIIKALFSSNDIFKKPDLIWAFSPFFNSSENSYGYKKKLLNKLKKTNNKDFCLNIIKAINSLKTEDLFRENRRYSDEILNINQKSNILEKYRNYDNWGIWYDINPIILRLLGLLYELNKNNWYEIINKFKNPIIIHSINDDYRRNNKNQYSIPDKIKKIDDTSIALIILNSMEKINQNDLSKTAIQKYFTNILNQIDRLKYKKFYWYGILADSTYIPLYNDKREKFLPILRKQIQKNIIKNLQKVNNKKFAIKYFIKGFHSHFIHISFRHLDFYKKIKNKDLSDYIKKIIIDNYEKSINKGRFYAPLKDKTIIEYTNVLIDSICELTINKNFSVTKLFNKILKKFYLTKEDYIYHSSEMIQTKDCIMHFFTVMFYSIETLQKTKNAISKKDINKYFDIFINFINLHTWFVDEQLRLAIDVIFQLDIVIKNDILYKEINLLMNKAIPPFSLLAILISKVPQDDKTEETRTFLKNYFEKYHKYWKDTKNSRNIYKNRHFEEWIDIAFIIKDKNMALKCIDNLPQNDLSLYKERYEKIFINS